MVEKTNITKDTPPELIEQDIARTRAEMSGTVDEIQERLSAQHLKEHAKESIRETTTKKLNQMKQAAARIGQTAKERGTSIMHTAKQGTSSVMGTVRSNPIPLVIIGAGVGWLVYNRIRNGDGASSPSMLKEQAGELTSKAQEKMSELSEQARETGSELAGRAKESAGRVSRVARERAQSVQSGFSRMVQNNPVGVLLGAFGIGAVAGFLIPESGKEQEMMGSASGSLLSKAKETAQRTIQKAQHAAERAVETAEEEFKKSAA